MTANLNILILEDNENDADLLYRELKKSGLSFNPRLVQTKSDFELALDEHVPDLILSDYSLPSFDAVSAFRIVQQKHTHIPFIIISGIIGEENVVDLIKEGVTDYVSKQKLSTLTTKIFRALKDVAQRKEKNAISERLRLQTVELSILNKELELRVENRTRALAESENRFRTMMETIPQIAWTNTIEGKVTFYNRRWYDYTGLKEEKHGLTGLQEVVHPEDRNTYESQFRTILNSNTEGEFQVRGKRADGSYRWQLIRMVPVLDSAGQVQLWAGTATDIQELKQLQQHKDDFISIASHELKTPITSLKASLQLLDRLKESPSSAMLPILITQANRNLNKVNTLIEDLLNASLANEGQLQVNRKSVHIGNLLAECCEQVREGGVYTIITEGNGDFNVYADAVRIEQVVVNFVNNAIKYAAESKEILIRIEAIEDQLKVSVIDKGQGIDPKKCSSLFDRYYRVDHSNPHYNGLGLGLYISSEIIKKHHGEIGVDSEIGQGSTFWFTIPMEAALSN